jgi:hypothetical protein
LGPEEAEDAAVAVLGGLVRGGIPIHVRGGEAWHATRRERELLSGSPGRVRVGGRGGEGSSRVPRWPREAAQSAGVVSLPPQVPSRAVPHSTEARREMRAWGMGGGVTTITVSAGGRMRASQRGICSASCAREKEKRGRLDRGAVSPEGGEVQRGAAVVADGVHLRVPLGQGLECVAMFRPDGATWGVFGGPRRRRHGR